MGILIINGDCMEIMGKWRESFIDAIVTSPPYNLGGDIHIQSKRGRINYGYDNYDDNIPERDYQQWQLDFLNLTHGLVKPNGFLFYIHKNRIKDGRIISPLEWILNSPWNVNQVVVLDQGAGANTDNRRFYPAHELLFILSRRRGEKLNNKFHYTDIWKVRKKVRMETGHPCPFDTEIVYRCLSAIDHEIDLVVDPFCGIGTTLIVCKEMGIKAIGMDISRKYCEIALDLTDQTGEITDETGTLDSWL